MKATAIKQIIEQLFHQNPFLEDLVGLSNMESAINCILAQRPQQFADEDAVEAWILDQASRRRRSLQTASAELA